MSANFMLVGRWQCFRRVFSHPLTVGISCFVHRRLRSNYKKFKFLVIFFQTQEWHPKRCLHNTLEAFQRTCGEIWSTTVMCICPETLNWTLSSRKAQSCTNCNAITFCPAAIYPIQSLPVVYKLVIRRSSTKKNVFTPFIFQARIPLSLPTIRSETQTSNSMSSFRTARASSRSFIFWKSTRTSA